MIFHVNNLSGTRLHEQCCETRQRKGEKMYLQTQNKVSGVKISKILLVKKDEVDKLESSQSALPVLYCRTKSLKNAVH